MQVLKYFILPCTRKKETKAGIAFVLGVYIVQNNWFDLQSSMLDLDWHQI